MTNGRWIQKGVIKVWEPHRVDPNSVERDEFGFSPDLLLELCECGHADLEHKLYDDMACGDCTSCTAWRPTGVKWGDHRSR